MLVSLVALLVGGAGGYLLGNGGGSDVSVSGQVTYACALVEEVRVDHRTEEDWGQIGEDRAYNEVAAIGGLLGGFVPMTEPEEEFSALGSQIFGSLSRAQFDDLNSALESTLEACENR